jgi:N-acetylmuramoyl-L-alanine amidase
MKIFLDPGHGNPDPGAVVENFSEADYNYFIAKMIEAHTLGCSEITISRTDNEKPTFEERAKRAKEFNADLVISIHCNSNDNPNASGMTAFYRHQDGNIGSGVADVILRSAPTALYHLGRKSTPVDETTWVRCSNVLRHYEMPAILLELGFLSNSHDRLALESIPCQLGIVSAIMCGMLKLMQVQDGV